MKRTVVALLIVGATAAWAADDNWDQRNVYEALGGVLKPAVGATVDEQITSRIKRYMANLLYPVDLSSVLPPEKDASFRNLIIALQKQMGVPSTGMLTLEQFNRLGDAARDIEAKAVGLPLLKTVSANDRYVSAAGTLSGDNLAHKLNYTRIECFRAGCRVFSASIDPDKSSLWLDYPASYEIKVWSAHAIIAVGEGPCVYSRSVRPAVIATLTIDLPAETVTLSDTGSCLDNTPNAFKLVEGFPIAWKFFQEKANKARMLVYEPAQRLIPIIQDYVPSAQR